MKGGLVLVSLVFIILFMSVFVSAFCNDSDSGINYYVKGTVTFDGGTSTDFCYDNFGLSESYCSPNYAVAVITYNCPNGCVDGACINSTSSNQTTPPTCTDSDGGVNYYVKGTVNSALGVTTEDLCVNSTLLNEDSCPSNVSLGTQITAYNCPYGCSDGACITPSNYNSTGNQTVQTTCTPAGYSCVSGTTCSQSGGNIIQGYSCFGINVCCSYNHQNNNNSFDAEAYCSSYNGTLCPGNDICNGGGSIVPGLNNTNTTLSNGQICCIRGTCMTSQEAVYESGVNKCTVNYNNEDYNYYYINKIDRTCPIVNDITGVTCTPGQECYPAGSPITNSNEPICVTGGMSTICIANSTAAECYRGDSCPVNSHEAPSNITSPYINENNTPSCVSGCLYNKKCLPYGYRVGNNYCNLDNNLKEQNNNGTCDNNFECVSNICANSECVSQNFLQAIINFFRNLLGIQ